jgi:hypothetical protein
MTSMVSTRRWCLAALALFIVMVPAVGHCLSKEDIFAWVAARMNLHETHAIPTVMFVDKTDIQQAFIEGNRNGYLRWEKEYGKNKAEKILQSYLDDIVGLFNDKTRIIYVGSFMSPCKQQAVLAHEFTHYYQFVRQGPVPHGDVQEDLLRLSREMEAYAIEKQFEEAFCADNWNAVVARNP